MVEQKSKIKLSFYGGTRTVTGANYLLEIGSVKILVDCGLFQGQDRLEKRNSKPFEYDPKSIDFVLITHAHLDHIGRLPRLISEGFNGEILATMPTIDFARLILEDSQKILEEKAARAGIIPIVTARHVEDVLNKFRPVHYEESIKLAKNTSVSFRDAGHVLGSACIVVTVGSKKIVFSGDLGSGRMDLLNKPAYIKEADYVVMESTYGDKFHESLEQSQAVIEEVIENTVKRKGVLMIPSFALERAQELLYYFNELVENKRIPRVPFFIDSPLAIKITKVYRRYFKHYSQQAKSLIKSGDDIFNFPGLKLTLSSKESRAINHVKPPKIIIAGSGMSCGGRIMHHEIRYLSDPNNTLLIVTYQAAGTLGRQILEGAKKVRIFDKPVSIKAKIVHVNGYSSHADQTGLMDWLGSMIHFQKPRLKKVFVCHGEEEPSLILAKKIKKDFNVESVVPKLKETFELVSNHSKR